MPGRAHTLSFTAFALAGGLALSGLALRSPDPSAGFAPRSSEPASEATDPRRPVLGAPVMLSCQRARVIVAEVRARLAVPVDSVDDQLFAELAAGWLDPHGLWSAASDAPAGALLYERARSLRTELESPRGSCDEASAVGAALEAWVHQLALGFDAARAAAPALSRPQAYQLAVGSIFEDDPVTLPAAELAAALGGRVGSFESAYGELGSAPGDSARARYFPEIAAVQWQEVLLTAAVRAYVAVVDPHGQWVPHAEESSLYVDDPTFDSEPRLWGDMMRTAAGVRIIDSPAGPLELDDLVLSVDGVVTAGLSVEHVDELARAPFEAGAPVRHVVVLRQGSAGPESLVVSLDVQSDDYLAPSLEVEDVPYGRGRALLVRIPDVPDDLGQQLADLIAGLEPNAAPLGILLDLRGNGGGSTEGACGALGVFLPGAPMFPLIHRGRVVEVLSALAPSRAGRWQGPVAALVDARTASAAEMIAGALDHYGRGATIGTRTFGKGCVQEYFDDAVGAGVLRLTTLLFSLPDGASVQRVGLEPRLRVALDEQAGERESDLQGAMPGLTGPDVRAAAWLGGPSWPDHRGQVGPCSEAAVCSALRRIGTAARSGRRDAAGLGRRHPAAR